MPATPENEIANAVIRYLEDHPNHKDKIRNIIARLPEYLNLTQEDEQESQTRPGEALWEQRVRNIVSHKETPGNAIYEGRLGHEKPAILFIP